MMWLSRLAKIGIILGIFMLGWIAANVQSQQIGTIENLWDYRFLSRGNFERHSPADRISQDQIQVYDDRVILDLKGATWATYADTNSMDPIFDSGANGIELPPKSEDDLKVGDVISFTNQNGNGLIVHRIIQIGEDEQGWFARTRGDNNITRDPFKVRFENVHGVLVGILY